MATYKELAEFYALAPSEDAVLEVWRNHTWEAATYSPRLSSDITEWRWKPTKTPVDMDVLLSWDIDCLVGGSADDCRYLVCLYKIVEGVYHTNGTGSFRYCKPRTNHWISANNFGYRGDDVIADLEEAGFQLMIDKRSDAVVAFKIVGLAADKCWPWEA